ncbi:MAG: hypothetical protein QXS54_00370 [Candidatus Methanomethylicaceae archaeon]
MATCRQVQFSLYFPGNGNSSGLEEMVLSIEERVAIIEERVAHMRDQVDSIGADLQRASSSIANIHDEINRIGAKISLMAKELDERRDATRMVYVRLVSGLAQSLVIAVITAAFLYFLSVAK